MKIVYIDVETTGIECPECGLVQLAGAIEVDGALAERFDFHIRPFPGDAISDEALAVNGLTREDLDGYQDPADAFRGFLALLGKYIDRYDRTDKFHMVGYNAMFDSDHLRAWFEKNKDRYFGSWFWHPPLDVMGMAALVLMKNRHTMSNFRLPTVAGALGFDADQTRMHDAGYDIFLTRELFQHLLTRMHGIENIPTASKTCGDSQRALQGPRPKN